MGQGMSSNSPRRIFNKWNDTGLPKLKVNTDGVYIGDVIASTIDAGETHIGEVGVKWAVSSATIFLDTAAYAALDNAASGVAAYGALEFVGAARVNAGGGIIKSVVFADSHLQTPNFTLILFSAVPGTTHGLINAAFQLADGDLPNIVGIVAAGTGILGARYPNTSKAWASVIDGGIQRVETAIPFVCATGTSLYGRIRADDTWDAAVAGDLHIKLLIEQG